MQARVRILFGRGRALLLSALLSTLMFYYCSAPNLRSGHLPERQVIVALLVFVLLFAALRLFALGCSRRLNVEQSQLSEGRAAGRGLKFFVFYKELIKAAVGVSLTLAWIAGLLLVTEKLGASFLLVPLLVGTVLTGVLTVLARFFVLFVDHIPYPWAE